MSRTEPNPIRVMLVDDTPERAVLVSQRMELEGFCVHVASASNLSLLKEISQYNPDVIVFDMASPDRDVLESLLVIKQHQPLPVVMFCENEDPGYIKKAVEAGVSTYLFGSINPDQVKPVIDIALTQFETYRRLEEELAATREELEMRETLDAAKRLLIKQSNISEQKAYAALRSAAMSEGKTIHQIAKRLLKQA